MSSLTELLAARTGLRELEVRRIMVTAPSRYKVYRIPKRDGGVREVSQPSREVKALQREFMSALLKGLPVHRAARAYVPGLSLRDNAKDHAGDGPLLKMDFRNFFPSLRSSDWGSYCARTGCLTDTSDIYLSSRLLFKKTPRSTVLRLAIGAPSSPMLSNVLMYKFDEMISAAVEESSRGNVRYTRYADDLTFSAPRTGYLNGVQSKVAAVIRALQTPSLEINGGKTTEVTRKYHRSVTGLTLANDGRITMGRDEKRLTRSRIHHALNGSLSKTEIKSLAGYLAYINSVEPEYLKILMAKFGADAVQRLMREKLL